MSGLACASDGRDGGPRFFFPLPHRTCVPGLARHATGPRWAGAITCALWMCLDGEAKPPRDCNALSAGFLPARHGLHMGCQCESDSLSYAASPLQPRANFSTWPCHARFSLALFVCVCVSLLLTLDPSVLFSQGSHPPLLHPNNSPFVKLNFASQNICLPFRMKQNSRQTPGEPASVPQSRPKRGSDPQTPVDNVVGITL